MSTADNRPGVYVTTDDKCLTISKYQSGDAEFENNHIELRETYNGILRNTTGDITATVLRNVLEQAGIRVVLE